MFERDHLFKTFTKGKKKISDISAGFSFSKRAYDGKLKVVKSRCPYCRHHKAFSSHTGLKCTGCKKQYE